MAKWERVIVYSLLFVSRFLGLRKNHEITSATESVAEEIRAKRFVAVNNDGVEVGVFGTGVEERLAPGIGTWSNGAERPFRKPQGNT